MSRGQSKAKTHAVRCLAFAASLLAAAAARADSPGLTAAPSPILIQEDFEQDRPSGPDTYRVFDRPGGSLTRSESFRVSGDYSLRLREAQGNRDFSEYMAFLPEQKSGVLLVRFWLLFANPEAGSNFAMAGPKWFLHDEPGGHAFWLANRGGMLRHRTGRKWQDLFAPKPFVWYLVDLLFDIDRGRYALAIYEEGNEKPLVDLTEQRDNNDADPTSVAYLSWIGDLEDRDTATFYLDDLLVAKDPGLRLPPFVAPGRRQFFVDRLAVPTPDSEPPEAMADLLAEARQRLRQGLAAARLEAAEALRLERAGDEAFRRRDLDLAEELYRALATRPDSAARMWLKLADVAYLRGDRATERQLREAIYGRLEAGPDR